MNGSRGISLRYVYLTLGICSLTVLAAVTFASRIGLSMTTTIAPLAASVQQMKLEVTTAHLWFEEAIAGDSSASVDLVWEHLDRARWFADAMLNGADSEEYLVVALDDPGLRSAVTAALVELSAFRSIAESRLESYSMYGPGSKLDEEFDAVFKALLAQADVVQIALRSATSRQLRAFRNIEGALLVACLLVSILLACVFYRFDRRNADAFVAIRHAENRERQAGQSIAAVLRSIGDGVIATDTEGRVTEINPAASILTAWPSAEAISGNIADVLSLEPGHGLRGSLDLLRSVVESKDMVGWENAVMRARDGDVCPVDCCAAPIIGEDGEVTGMVVSFRDISERQATEAELSRYRSGLEQLVEERTRDLSKSHDKLLRSERLAAIGTLAAGIAHEINNPLGMILLETGRALECEGLPAEARTQLGRSQDHAQRCGRIVKGILRFARQQPSEKISLNLNEVVNYSVSLLAGYANERGVALEVELAGDLPAVLANRVELEQVLMNLARNSVQACGGSGRVRIETSVQPEGILLVVRDDGCGMSAAEREHAFDPFYTTRQGRGGTGLGLSTVHGIIADHGGVVDISSEPGNGAVVSITLPGAVARPPGINHRHDIH